MKSGKSLLDDSIMIDLRSLLGIKANELLSEEKISMENYKVKVERNIIGITTYLSSTVIIYTLILSGFDISRNFHKIFTLDLV